MGDGAGASECLQLHNSTDSNFRIFLRSLTCFAGLNLLLVIIVLEVFGRLFRKQQIIQRGYVEAKRNKEAVAPAERLGSRIQTAEFGTLLASFLVVALMGVLIWLSISGVIELSNTIVFFLGLRLLNTTFSSVSSSLMRFARAKANSF